MNASKAYLLTAVLGTTLMLFKIKYIPEQLTMWDCYIGCGTVYIMLLFWFIVTWPYNDKINKQKDV